MAHREKRANANAELDWLTRHSDELDALAALEAWVAKQRELRSADAPLGRASEKLRRSMDRG